MGIVDPGTHCEQSMDRYERFVNPSLVRVMRFMGLESVEWYGQGAIVQDHLGEEYIDCAGGFGVFFHGHRHPRIVAAAHEQLDRLPLSTRLLISDPPGTLGELLARITPGDLRYSFFANSGTEAVEGAIKFARITTGRINLVCTRGAFHGKTLGSLSASGREGYKKDFVPLVPGFSHVDFGDLDAMRLAVDERTAAVMVEPIQGENGVILPPDGYLAGLREICDRSGALLILDEVQTGMGRTGRMFACEYEGVAPDIMCLSKALGGGVVPLGAIVGTPRVWEFFEEYPLLHTSTMGGNPLCCAVASEAIRVTLDEGLLDRAQTLGKYCLDRMTGLKDKYPEILADVRGRGLLIGMEFHSAGMGGSVMSGLIDRKVLATYSLNNQQVIRWTPAAVITDTQIETALDALAASVAETAELASDL